jgi:type I restriction enzyme, S subunit
MKKYDSYKDSGVEWIGEVPEHWEVKKVNYCFAQIGSGTTPTAGNQNYYGNGTYNWLQTGDLNDGEIFETAKKITQQALADYSTLRFYPVDSLVIAMYGATIGKTGLLKIQTTTNQACCVLSKPKNVNHRFAFYWLNSIRNHIISLSYGGGQPNINQEQIRNLRIQLPLESEQTAIASYLDRKTAEIDQLIADKKRLITLYEEEKTALINQAVTKGINPNVKMKDSGIEWLGEVPAHWDVSFVKRFSQITDGSHFSPQTQDIGLPYVSVKDVGINQIDLANCKRISEDDFNVLIKNGCMPKVGDVLLTKDGTIGRAAVVYQTYAPFVVLSSLGIISPGHKILPDYLYFYLISGINIDQMYSLIHGSALTRLTIEKISSLIIAIPSFEEQILITKHISEGIKTLNSKIAKTQKLIDLLSEYRTSLISEVVTGKVRVA